MTFSHDVTPPSAAAGVGLSIACKSASCGSDPVSTPANGCARPTEQLAVAVAVTVAVLVVLVDTVDDLAGAVVEGTARVLAAVGADRDTTESLESPSVPVDKPLTMATIGRAGIAPPEGAAVRPDASSGTDDGEGEPRVELVGEPAVSEVFSKLSSSALTVLVSSASKPPCRVLRPPRGAAVTWPTMFEELLALPLLLLLEALHCLLASTISAY